MCRIRWYGRYRTLFAGEPLTYDDDAGLGIDPTGASRDDDQSTGMEEDPAKMFSAAGKGGRPPPFLLSYLANRDSRVSGFTVGFTKKEYIVQDLIPT